MLSNYLILCYPVLLLPSVFSSIRVFSNELALCIRRPKYWSLSFSTSPSNEYSGLISLRIDQFDLLAVQRTLPSFLQHHSSKASIFQCSAFFIVQLSHPYTTTGKTIAFVSKIMSLLFSLRHIPSLLLSSSHWKWLVKISPPSRAWWPAGSGCLVADLEAVTP